MATPLPRNEASFAFEAIVRATGGTVRAAGNDVHGVVTDSRAVEPGNLFVALQGDQHDAHRFLPDVARRGAAAVVVHRGAEVPAGLGAVEVDDTQRALGDLAAMHRRRWARPVVAITGSAGKTTTKELTAAALAIRGRRVARTAGNLNNLVGLPMTLLALTDDDDMAVVELGTNHPGEIARLAEIARPDVGVVVLVAAAHTEGIGSLDQVAEEKTALLRALRPTERAVVNGDDEMLRGGRGREHVRHVVSFGTGEHADVRLASWHVDSELHTACTFAVSGRQEPVHLRLRLIGESAALNAAAALAIAHAWGEDMDEAAAALAEVSPGPGRMCPRHASNGCVVLDDTYNANPRSTERALDTAIAAARARGTRAIAVLGDMLELGERARQEHEAIGEHAARAGVAALIGCGTWMAHATRTADEHGLDTTLVSTAGDCVQPVRELVDPGDVVLVKGSRSARMERVVEALLGEEEA